jgi:hypothetical protein
VGVLSQGRTPILTLPEELDSIKLSADTKKTIPLPPIVGGAAIVAGIALILVERRKK